MFIAGVASSVLSSVTTALTSPNSATVPVSPSKTQPNGSTQSNNPTGSTNPFQSLSADMQSWLTQNQAANNPQSGMQTHHHHHHGGGDAQQQAGDADTSSNADPTATTPSATA